MDEEERKQLFEALLARLEEAGVPDGLWLAELGRLEYELQDGLTTVRRLIAAIIRSSGGAILLLLAWTL